MKLHAGTHTIEKSDNFEESKFSIEASSKAFFILSDGLYSNKILAVVRELSTNAYDSHVEAGKAHIPFDVHLPTQLEPIFFIRDYGTSMSHADCMQLYTTYFRSTRNNSNDAVGCLGLGSKAPFAYADSFTVEAYLDGKKRSYTGYKNEDGSPVFSLLDESDTDEQDGIKVSINVQSYDVSRFVGEAREVYEFFKVRPNFVGASIQYAEPKKVLEGDGWYFDDDNNDNVIIMGQIAYPLNAHQVAGSDNPKEFQFLEYSSGLRIFVNIGDVDITPSREALSYSKETKANILRKVNTIATEITNKIEQEIKNQPTLFKARVKYVQISDQCHSIKSAVESLQKSITWNDIKLFDSIAGESVDIKDKISCISLHKHNYRKKIDTDYKVERLHFSSRIKFVVDNLPRGGMSRVKQYMRDDGYGSSFTCYIYKLTDNETIDNCKLYEMMGGATKEDVILTSTLDKVEYNRSSNGGSGDSGPAIQAQVFNEETGKFEVCNMSVKYENAHYFTESKGEVSIGYTSISISDLEHTLSWIHEHYNDDVTDMTFYIVKPSIVKNRKLDERGNWRDGSMILNKVFADAVEKNRENIIKVHTRYNLSNHRNEKWTNVLEMTKTNSKAKQIVSDYNEYKDSIDKMSGDMHMIQNMARMLSGVEPVNFSNVKTNSDKFSKEFDEEMKKYPMLKVVSSIWSDTDRQLVADYIDSIENSTK